MEEAIYAVGIKYHSDDDIMRKMLIERIQTCKFYFGLIRNITLYLIVRFLYN